MAVAGALVAASCDSEAGFPDARIPDAAPVPGTFSLAWSLTDTADAMAVTCDDVNATTVTITVREQGASSGSVEVFNCNSGSATSRPYAPGTYVLTFELRGSAGLIAMAPPRNDVVVTSTTDNPIGVVDFQMDANGGFSIDLTSMGTTTNCDPVAGGGGGITTVELTLIRDSTCVPFTYTAGAASGTTTCPATGVACIERTVTIDAADLEAGRYQLDVIGNIGAAECWLGSAAIRVPIEGAVGSFMMILMYQPLVPGCPPLS